MLSLPRYASIDNAIQTLGFNINGELSVSNETTGDTHAGGVNGDGEA